MVRFLLIRLISGYRYFLSPWLGNNCRFYPSCSDYSQQCLRRYSILYALWLTVKRLVRCNPWSAGGLDPVPDDAR